MILRSAKPNFPLIKVSSVAHNETLKIIFLQLSELFKIVFFPTGVALPIHLGLWLGTEFEFKGLPKHRKKGNEREM